MAAAQTFSIACQCSIDNVMESTGLKKWVMNNLLVTFCLYFTRTFLNYARSAELWIIPDAMPTY